MVTEIKLCDKELCTGCMACYNACPHGSISIKTDDEGFVAPVINHDTCLKCGKCMIVCPILHELEPCEDQVAFKGWAIDKSIRRNSSSGGIFSLLSNHVLKNGGYVFGAAFDEEFKLKHQSVHIQEEMPKLRGSKYVQSYIGETLLEVKQKLDEGVMVLFSGTPCQVAGLKGFLCNKDYPNLLTIDLVCHAVPSPKVFMAYKEWLENEKKSQITDYSFRDKKWCWTHFNSKITFKDGSLYYGKWEEDPWSRGFLRELFLRHSCHNCKFANMNRQGDITLADYWSYTCKKNEKSNKETGCSLILCNSDKGSNAVNLCKSEMVYYPITINEARRCNRALNSCFPASSLRKQFWEDFNTKPFSVIVNKYMYPDPIPIHYRLVYRFGKEALVVKLYDFGQRVSSAIKRRLKFLY